MIRKYLVFYGSVQGVGFRWRAHVAAQQFLCTGWVRNEWDGSVSMEIQGTEEAIDSVIRSIDKGTYVEIERIDAEVIPLIDGECGFRMDYV